MYLPVTSINWGSASKRFYSRTPSMVRISPCTSKQMAAMIAVFLVMSLSLWGQVSAGERAQAIEM